MPLEWSRERNEQVVRPVAQCRGEILARQDFTTRSVQRTGAGWVIDTRFRLPGIIATFLALGSGLVLLISVPTSQGSALLIGGLLGAAALASQSILYAVAPDCYPTAVRGQGVGTAVSAGRFGSIAGPIVAAQLLVGGRSPADVLQAMLPLVAIGLACTLLLGWAGKRPGLGS